MSRSHDRAVPSSPSSRPSPPVDSGTANPTPPPAPSPTAELASLTELWRWLSIPVLLYDLGMWLKTQGDFELVKPLARTQEQAVIFGLLASPLVFACIYLASWYARLRQDQPIAERVPGFLRHDLGSTVGRRVRVSLALGVLSILVGTQLHFLRRLVLGDVYRSHDLFASGFTQMLFRFDWGSLLSNEFHFGAEGPTFFPGVESWFWTLSVLALTVRFVWYLTKDLRIAGRSMRERAAASA